MGESERMAHGLSFILVSSSIRYGTVYFGFFKKVLGGPAEPWTLPPSYGRSPSG